MSQQPVDPMTDHSKAAYDAAYAEAALAERARLAAILNSPEATGRTELARYLAFATDFTAAACLPLLRAAPKEAPALVQESRFIPAGPRADDAPGGLVLAADL